MFIALVSLGCAARAALLHPSPRKGHSKCRRKPLRPRDVKFAPSTRETWRQNKDGDSADDFPYLNARFKLVRTEPPATQTPATGAALSPTRSARAKKRQRRLREPHHASKEPATQPHTHAHSGAMHTAWTRGDRLFSVASEKCTPNSNAQGKPHVPSETKLNLEKQPTSHRTSSPITPHHNSSDKMSSTSFDIAEGSLVLSVATQTAAFEETVCTGRMSRRVASM